MLRSKFSSVNESTDAFLSSSGERLTEVCAGYSSFFMVEAPALAKEEAREWSLLREELLISL